MPYRKRRYSTKPYYGSRRPYRKRPKRGNYIFYRRLRNKVFRMARYMNVEFKQHNLAITPTVSNSLTTHQLTNIAQGDTDTTRDGNSIKLASIYIQGFATINALATNTIIRLLLVLDKQTNQAIYTAGDLLLSDSVTSPNNIDNGRRFKILWEHRMILSQDRPMAQFKLYKKLNMHIRYDSTGTNIQQLTQNSLSLARISNEGTNVPSMDYTVRIRYVDN